MEILIVDDDNVSFQLAKTLKNHGHSVTIANNLADAEYFLSESMADGLDYKKYQAIILDLSMPNLHLPKELILEARESYAGWVFYKHIISQYVGMKERTIFWSGYANALNRLIEKDEVIRFVHKGGDGSLQALLQQLDSIDLLSAYLHP